MKKLIAVIGLLTLLSNFTQAQTNSPTPPASFWGGLGQMASSLGISTNPTNYAGFVFGGVKTDGSQYSAGFGLVENVTSMVGVSAVVDHLWLGGKAGSANLLSGGITLKQATHPFQWLGFGTNTFLYKATVTPYAMALAGAAIGNTATSGGGLCSIVRGGVNLDVYTFSGWTIGVGTDYGSRSGSGNYNGNWIDFTGNIRKGF